MKATTVIQEMRGWTYNPLQNWDPCLQDAENACLLGTVEDLCKGISKLVGLFAELEGIEGIVEAGETDNVERGAGEPGEHFDLCLTRLRRGIDLLQ